MYKNLLSTPKNRVSMDIPGYDDYKLASPPESDLCRYCDEDALRDIARDRATEFNMEWRKDVDKIVAAIKALHTKVRMQGYEWDELYAFTDDIPAELNAFTEALESDLFMDATSDAGLCRNCHEIDEADMRDDD